MKSFEEVILFRFTGTGNGWERYKINGTTLK